MNEAGKYDEERAIQRPAHVHPSRLRSMFAPKGIALVGGSDNSAWSRFTYNNLTQGGYPHEIRVVNRRGGIVHGRAAATSLTELGVPIDLAIVMTGAGALPAVMADAHEAGIPNLVVISSGFSEMGEIGRRRESEVVALATAYGQIVLGPNNVGFINNASATMAWSSTIPWPQTVGRIGIMSHSGALAILLLKYLANRDIALSHVVTLGNEAMVTVAEGIDYLVADEKTKVIGLYLESIRHPEAFVAAADRAMEAGKPIVVYKAGRGALGGKATAAHTGSLADDDRVIDAVFRQHGVIRVNSIEDLVTTCSLLEAYGELPGNRVGFVFGSGAVCAIFGDSSEEYGLDLPDFAQSTVDELHVIGLPDFATAQNPLDVTGQAVTEPDLLVNSEEVVSRDPNIDMLVVISDIPGDEDALEGSWTDVHRRIELANNSPVPVIATEFLPADRSHFARNRRRLHGSPLVLDSLSRTVPALSKAVWWSKRRRATAKLAWVSTQALASTPDDRRGPWTERQLGELLERNAVPVVPQRLVTSAADAAAVSAEFGYPVALKISSADIPHKSDFGGVVLGVSTPAEAQAAYQQIMTSIANAAPQADVEGVIVSPMRPQGVDLLVGVVRDRSWGLTLVVGLGGIWVEVLKDSAIRILPVSAEQVREMLEELRSFPLLTGARGSEAVDLDRLIEVIVRVSDVAMALGDDLDELEINPLRANGGKVEVLDALVRWRNQSTVGDGS